ncbi:MAG: c-type cytochrome [Nitrospira sp.]|nr:c-type cytochrome [Nitrospira sp.]
MSVFFIKSLLSVVMVLLAVISALTMLELFGRPTMRFKASALKKLHKFSGVSYLIIFIGVSFLCMELMVFSKIEFPFRSILHATLAILIITLLFLKLSFIKLYREYYKYVMSIGLTILVFTILMAGLSGGYYLLVSGFGTDIAFDKILTFRQGHKHSHDAGLEIPVLNLKTDPESIGKGQNLFDKKCKFCHDAYSTARVVGPGLKGILKNPKLPMSKSEASPENIFRQLQKPMGKMPSFEYFTKEEIEDVISYLNTL